MSDECPTCGAGRNEETDDLYARLTTAEAEVSRLRGALERIARERCQLPPAGTWCTNEHTGTWCDHQEARRALSATPAVPMTLDPLPDVVLNVIVDEALRIGNFAALANAKTPDPRPELLRRIREALARPQTAEPTPAKVCTRPEQCTNPKWCEAEEKCERELGTGRSPEETR